MYRILVSDSLEETGLAMLRESGHEVYEMKAEERPRLPELIADFDALVVRSSTKATGDLLRCGKKLRVVGRAGIGVDNVDVETATELGILVVNAPTANLLSATEHTFALLLALARNVPEADASMKAGGWNRSKFVGTELQGKTLGVIGFGRIGQRVARRAQAFEMKVLAYDPFLSPEFIRRYDAEPLGLDELLAQADMITLHTPLSDETRNLLDSRRLGLMKRGALLVNCGRGGVVDEEALTAALDSGHLGGAAIDVFAEEPPKDFALAKHPRVVATPHLGAQTREAQVRISTETARMVLAALDGSLAVTAVNLPFRPAGAAGEPYLRLAERLGYLAGILLEGNLQQISVELWGIEENLRSPVSVAALKGALVRMHGEAVNFVNAERIAADRGLDIVCSTHAEPADYPHLIRVRLAGSAGSTELAGTLFHGHDPRMVSCGGYRLEFQPRGHLMIIRNHDVPGVVGKLGTILGSGGVNIADIHLARKPSSDEALAVLRLDQAPPEGVVAQIRALDEVRTLHLVEMGRG